MTTLIGSNIVKAVLMILVVIALLIGVYTYGKQLIAPIIGLEVYNETQASLTANTTFEAFFNEYQQCKATSDKECVCPFTISAIPSGYFVEINNDPGTKTSTLKLFRGEIQKTFTELGSKQITNDITNMPTKSPGPLTSYLTPDRKFDKTVYFPNSPLYLVHEPPSYVSRKLAGEATPIDVHFKRNAALGDYNLIGIYKLDETNTAFAPTPRSVVSQLSGSYDDRIKEFQSLRKCKTLKTDTATSQLLPTLKSQYTSCLNSLDPKKAKVCTPFQTDIPKGHTLTSKRRPNPALLLKGPGQKKDEFLFKIDVSKFVCTIYDIKNPKVSPDPLSLTPDNKYASYVIFPTKEICLYTYTEAEIAQKALAAEPLFKTL